MTIDGKRPFVTQTPSNNTIAESQSRSPDQWLSDAYAIRVSRSRHRDVDPDERLDRRFVMTRYVFSAMDFRGRKATAISGPRALGLVYRQ